MGRTRGAAHLGVRRTVRILFMTNGSKVRLEFQTRQDELSRKHDETDRIAPGRPPGGGETLPGRSGENAVHFTRTHCGSAGRMA
jgi:hypothetical protein